MKIIDLDESHEKIYFCCLEDWSDEMPEAGDHKEKWYRKMKENQLIVKLAINDAGQACGMIQALPIEHSFAEGENLYFIACVWVHGYKQGIGNFQKKGIGKELLRAVEAEAQSRGANGIAAWGLSLPFWMKASWYKKHGYKKVDKQSIQALVWKPFNEQATPPKWIKPRKKLESVEGKVAVTAFLSGWCPAQNIVFERAKRAAAEFGDRVEFQHIDTSERDKFLEWGLTDEVFIDGKSVQAGPPPSYKKLKKKMAARVRKLGN